MPMPETRLAVDTNFVMDLARRQDDAFDALEVIRRRLRGAQIFVVPRVCKELAHKMLTDPDAKEREDARVALSNIRVWGMEPAELSDVQGDIAEIIGRKLLAQGIIPLKEHNDAVIVGEAAMLDCQLLLSSDTHVRDAEAARLALALHECGVGTVVVRRPDELTRMFGGR